MINVFQMLTNGKIISIEFMDFFNHFTYKRFSERYKIFCLICQILQFIYDLRLKVEYSSGKSNHVCGRSAFVHAEELKISAEIKDIENFRIPERRKQNYPTRSTRDLKKTLSSCQLFSKIQI